MPKSPPAPFAAAAASAPPASRRDRKREETAGRIVAAAFALFEAQGYAAVTMEQIAAAADVAKGTLYKHFPVKEALLRHRFHADLAEGMPGMFAELAELPDCAARLRAFLHRVAAFTGQFREYMAPYLQYRLSQPMDSLGRDNRSGLDRIYAKLLAEGQASGEIRADLPTRQLADCLQFMHLCTIMRWLHAPDTSLAAAFDAMLGLFLDGARMEKRS